MAVTRKKRERTKRTADQGYLPGEGMEPPRHKRVDDAADNYYDTMMDRVKLSKEEHELKDALIDKMKEHGIDRYEMPDGKIVMVTHKSNVRVKKKKAKKGAAPSENGEAEA